MRPTTLVNLFQEEQDIFESIRWGQQQTCKQKTEKAKVQLNRVKEGIRKQQSSKNKDVSQEKKYTIQAGAELCQAHSCSVGIEIKQ